MMKQRDWLAKNEMTISIYIHWPFCKSKCPYCDFNSHVSQEIDIDAWLSAYMIEFKRYEYAFVGKYVRSIFFGGGTPSLMPPKIVAELLKYISSTARVDEETEITLEANPTSSESQNFRSFAESGVNRLSIGIQAFDEKRLKFLGREHNLKEALSAIELASKIFPRFSFDLIYATPEQDVQMWEAELKQAMNFAVDHISLYQLTIEKGTQFFSSYAKGEFKLPDSDLADDLYEMTADILSKKEIYPYEISNYSKIGSESRHNMAYWEYRDYLGIGPGAHSRLSSGRDVEAFYMMHNPTNWLKTNLDGKSAVQNFEILRKEEILTEILMMGLRLSKGISYDNLQKLFGKDFSSLVRGDKLEFLVTNGLIFYDEKHVKLTKTGLKLHQKVMTEMEFNEF
jgi:putative oxygen-independent coproporphyrinogen III oxidase